MILLVFFFDPLWWLFICPTARNVSTTENVCQSYRACRPVCVYRNDANLKQDEVKAWMVKHAKMKRGVLSCFIPFFFLELLFSPFLLILLLSLIFFFFNGLRTTLFNNQLFSFFFFCRIHPCKKKKPKKQVKEKTFAKQRPRRRGEH